MSVWDGVRKAFHILIHDCFCFVCVCVCFPVSCVLTSGSASWKEWAGSCFSFPFCLCRVGLHACDSVSPLLSVALVSTLATVSVHSRLCRLGLHTCHCVSPQRPQVSQSPLNESIVNGYRRHVHISFHRGWTRILRWTPVSSSVHTQRLPLGPRCPNWMWPCTCCFLPQLSLPVNSRGRGAESRDESPIVRLVMAVDTACTCWTLIACQLHDGSLCCLSVHCV